MSNVEKKDCLELYIDDETVQVEKEIIVQLENNTVNKKAKKTLKKKRKTSTISKASLEPKNNTVDCRSQDLDLNLGPSETSSTTVPQSAKPQKKKRLDKIKKIQSSLS